MHILDIFLFSVDRHSRKITASAVELSNRLVHESIITQTPDSMIRGLNILSLLFSQKKRPNKSAISAQGKNATAVGSICFDNHDRHQPCQIKVWNLDQAKRPQALIPDFYFKDESMACERSRYVCKRIV